MVADSEALLEAIRNGVIGRDEMVEGPFGPPHGDHDKQLQVAP